MKTDIRKYAEKIQGSRKSDKSEGNFTWSLLYIFDHIVLTHS